MHYQSLTATVIPVILLAVLPSNSHATDGPAMPNIILLMSDDQGWGDVGFNGNKVVKTLAN